MRKKTLQEMKLMASERGGKCISKKYVNVKTHLLWECQYGHKWLAIPNCIQQGTWCPICANIETAKKNRLSIEHAIELAAKKGGGMSI